MEARFDLRIIRLPNRARAIDGVMFRREAWVVRSMLNIRASCQVMPYGQGGPSGEGHLRPEMVSLPRARPAQGHKIRKDEVFATLLRRPQSAFPFP